jgi:repressor LexA
MLDSEKFFERVQEALNERSVPEIGRKIGATKHAIYLWEKGQMPGMKSLKYLARVAELSNTSLHWLLTGKGDKYLVESISKDNQLNLSLEKGIKDLVEKAALQADQSIEDVLSEFVIEGLVRRGLASNTVESADLIFFGEYIPKLVPVPLFGEIAAGRPVIVFPEFEREIVNVAEDFIISGRKTFVLRVRGDSMIDEGIFDGDLIICIEPHEISPGQTVVALIDEDSATVKKYYRHSNTIRLEPANPSYKPIILPASRVRIQGIVIGIQRRK